MARRENLELGHTTGKTTKDLDMILISNVKNVGSLTKNCKKN
jgi:hypothetical protein